MASAALATASQTGIVRGAKIAKALRQIDPEFNLEKYRVRKLAEFIELLCNAPNCTAGVAYSNCV